MSKNDPSNLKQREKNVQQAKAQRGQRSGARKGGKQKNADGDSDEVSWCYTACICICSTGNFGETGPRDVRSNDGDDRERYTCCKGQIQQSRQVGK